MKHFGFIGFWTYRVFGLSSFIGLIGVRVSRSQAIAGLVVSALEFRGCGVLWFTGLSSRKIGFRLYRTWGLQGVRSRVQGY